MMRRYYPTQLEHDLLRNAENRLRTWIKDTIMRCDIVEMDDAKQVALVMSVLVDCLTEAAVKIQMDREEFLYMISEVYDEELQRISPKVKEKP